ncbi:hypothetical protein Sjap_013130 [Stephania japonica]|uniref:WAT1-related protein n=1 Tax=Stephania japonica TaxID=461633 RepID=A0AAP0IZ42_9MAGN
MESKVACPRVWRRVKPFLAVFFLQFGLAGLAIIAKLAMNQGMSPHTLTVYRHAIATVLISPFAVVFERRESEAEDIIISISQDNVAGPVIDQNLYYTGMKFTTATFTSAMGNILPALTFFMACILGLEKVNIRKARSQAKVVGTLASVGGAMIMTLIKGPVLELFWTKGIISKNNEFASGITHDHSLVKGSLMIVAGCFCWASFVILQATTLKEYPAELSLTAWICLMGTLEGAVVALAIEWRSTSAWSLNWDMKLFAALYSGIVCSGIGFYLQGMIMKERGPVFVTTFSPLTMVMVAILGSFILAERMYLGRVIGAVVIVVGLYLVVWGKSKDRITTNSSSTMSINGQIKPVKVSIAEVDGDLHMRPAHEHQFVLVDLPDTHSTRTDQLPSNSLID